MSKIGKIMDVLGDGGSQSGLESRVSALKILYDPTAGQTNPASPAQDRPITSAYNPKESLENLTESDLISLLKKRDENAWTWFILKHYGGVLYFAHNKVHNFHDAKDITQETFLRTYVTIDIYEPGRAKITTWLYTIAGNYARDILKKRQREVRRMDKITRQSSEFAAEYESTGEENKTKERLIDMLPSLIGRLSHDDQEMIMLRYNRGLTNLEISRIMEFPVDDIRNQFRGIKVRLYNILRGISENMNESTEDAHSLDNALPMMERAGLEPPKLTANIVNEQKKTEVLYGQWVYILDLAEHQHGMGISALERNLKKHEDVVETRWVTRKGRLMKEILVREDYAHLLFKESGLVEIKSKNDPLNLTSTPQPQS